MYWQQHRDENTHRRFYQEEASLSEKNKAQQSLRERGSLSKQQLPDDSTNFFLTVSFLLNLEKRKHFFSLIGKHPTDNDGSSAVWCHLGCWNKNQLVSTAVDGRSLPLRLNTHPHSPETNIKTQLPHTHTKTNTNKYHSDGGKAALPALTLDVDHLSYVDVSLRRQKNVLQDNEEFARKCWWRL